MLFLGVDPGLRRTGVGVVDYNGGKFRLAGHAIIEAPVKGTLTERLVTIVEALRMEVKLYEELHSAAIENIFHSVNIRSALVLGQTRGAIIASLITSGVYIYEYTPLQIKQCVTGYGKAEKEQVKRMVELQLAVKLDKLPFDISDALACAICHAVNIRSSVIK